jgi:hypothetical protein
MLTFFLANVSGSSSTWKCVCCQTIDGAIGDLSWDVSLSCGTQGAATLGGEPIAAVTHPEKGTEVSKIG